MSADTEDEPSLQRRSKVMMPRSRSVITSADMEDLQLDADGGDAATAAINGGEDGDGDQTPTEASPATTSPQLSPATRDHRDRFPSFDYTGDDGPSRKLTDNRDISQRREQTGTKHSRGVKMTPTVDFGQRDAIGKMAQAVETMKRSEANDIWDMTREVATHIYMPFHATHSEQTRHQLGDYLATSGGGRELTWFLASLLEIEDKTERIWQSIHFVQNTCWDYSDVSLTLCKEFGKCGLLNLMFTNLERFGLQKYTTMNERLLVISSLNILHNCSKTFKNLKEFKGQNAVRKLQPYTSARDKELAMLGLFILSYVADDTELDVLSSSNEMTDYILAILNNALDSPTLKGRSSEGNFSAVEILKSLSNLARNDRNKSSMVSREVAHILLQFFQRGRSPEKKFAANLLTVLLKLPSNRTKIIETKGLVNMVNGLCKSHDASVKEAAENVMMAIMRPASVTDIPGKREKADLARQRSKQAHRSLVYTSGRPDDDDDDTFELPLPKPRSQTLGRAVTLNGTNSANQNPRHSVDISEATDVVFENDEDSVC